LAAIAAWEALVIFRPGLTQKNEYRWENQMALSAQIADDTDVGRIS
jgi:hypothetical protein